MTGDGPRQDLVDLGELIAELAVEAVAIANALTDLDCFSDVIRCVRRMGYAEGRATWDDRQADATARERRAQFRIVR